MIVMVLKAPVSTIKGLWNYRWMASYLAAPAWIDRHTEGTRGTHLRIAHLHFNAMIKHTCNMIHMLLNMISIFIRMTNFQIKQFVWMNFSLLK